jgi:hypothetical protein
VQSADLIITGRVVQITIPDSGRGAACATLKVLSRIVGECGEKVKVEFYFPPFGPPAGEVKFEIAEEYVLILDRYDRPGVYHVNNMGGGMATIHGHDVDWRTMASTIGDPYLKKLKEDMGGAKGLPEFIKLVRGPVIEGKMVGKTVRYDRPITFRLKFTNPSFVPMPIMTGPEAEVKTDFDIEFFDSNGFRMASLRSGPDDVEVLKAAPAKAGKDLRVLDTGESVSFDVTFRIPRESWQRDPAAAATAVIKYYHGTMPDTKEPDIPPIKLKDDTPESLWKYHLPLAVWKGWSHGCVPVSIGCPDRKWTENMRTPNAMCAIQVEKPFFSDDPKATEVSVKIAAAPGPTVSHLHANWPFTVVVPEERNEAVDKELAGCLSIRRNGKLLRESARKAPELLRALKGRHISHYTLFDLAKYHDFSKPGVYEVRLVLPGEKKDSVSNVHTLTVNRVRP